MLILHREHCIINRNFSSYIKSTWLHYKDLDTKITRCETSTGPILDLATNVSAILKHNDLNIDTENA